MDRHQPENVRAQVLELLRVREVAVERVDRTHGIADRTLEVGAGVLHGACSGLDVPDVVERIEHTEDIDTVAVRRLHEPVDDLVGVVPVADKVLAAQKHLQRRAGTVLLDDAQTVPRVLVEEAQRRVERRPTPDLERPVADRVHLRQDRQHVAEFHTRRPERLMGVAKRGIRDPDRSHRTVLGRRYAKTSEGGYPRGSVGTV